MMGKGAKGVQSEVGEVLNVELEFIRLFYTYRADFGELGARRKPRCSQAKWRRKLSPLKTLKLSPFSQNL